MNVALLDQRLAAMARHPNVDAALIQRFRAALLSEDDWGLFRINPLQFAPKHGLSGPEALDLFVLGAREGLFDLAFLELCQYCGSVTHDVSRWGELSPVHFDCGLCRVKIDAALDGSIAVVFTVASAVRHLDLNPQADFLSHRRYHVFGGYQAPEAVLAYLISREPAFASVPPGGEAILDLDTGDESHVIVVCYEIARTEFIPVLTGAPSELTVRVSEDGLELSSEAIGPGRVRLRVRNNGPRDIGLDAFRGHPEAFHEAMLSAPPIWSPYVTARDLLSTQRFRDLFRAQDLPAELRLRIRSLTMLFTDLSGSTALYESTGDLTAFEIVRDHFAILGDCVRRHEGAVVKTMGDAVMASFPRPDLALLAACEMLDAMAPISERAARFGRRVGLKVGVHEGAALVVNAEDRLDYFGQTVNVAARVQGLAAAGELWMTQPVFDAAGTLLPGHGFRSEPQRVPLKGVEGLVDVVRCTREVSAR